MIISSVLDEYDLEMPMDQPYFSPSDRNAGLFRPMNLDVIDPVVYSSSPFLTRLQAAAIVPNTRRHRRGKCYTHELSFIILIFFHISYPIRHNSRVLHQQLLNG